MRRRDSPVERRRRTQAVRRAKGAYVVDLADLAVVIVDTSGKLVGGSAASGVLWGMLFGLLFFVPFAGALIGGAMDRQRAAGPYLLGRGAHPHAGRGHKRGYAGAQSRLDDRREQR